MQLTYLGLAASVVQAGRLAVTERAGASNAPPAGYSCDRGCQCGRRPVAPHTTSAGIGIALHRVSFGRSLGTRAGGVGTRELNSCTLDFFSLWIFSLRICFHLLICSPHSLRLDLFSFEENGVGLRIPFCFHDRYPIS